MEVAYFKLDSRIGLASCSFRLQEFNDSFTLHKVLDNLYYHHDARWSEIMSLHLRTDSFVSGDLLHVTSMQFIDLVLLVLSTEPLMSIENGKSLCYT